MTWVFTSELNWAEDDVIQLVRFVNLIPAVSSGVSDR
jgi:hypothetical protein